jgi:regulator of cell morphogenesis and NO signaling
MRVHPTDTLGDIVASDYRAAAVFEEFGLDFCCGGRQTLNEACQKPAIDAGALLRALDELPGKEGEGSDAVAEYPLDRLIDHIVIHHHTYVRSAIPVLTGQISKIVAAHGNRSPELLVLAREFAAVADGMSRHMVKEEQILFPYIRSLVEAETAGRRRISSPFGTVHNPIRMMETEHEEAGDEMRSIRELTHDYRLPEFACSTYKACFENLQQFEHDLHRHVHLENNVLFPRAIALEQQLL